MVTFDTVLVRYGEIALKDRWTRKSWERILASNISFALREAKIEYEISNDRGRIFFHTTDERASELIANVFGVVSASPVCSVKPDIVAVSETAVKLAESIAPSSFAIRPRRGGGDISSAQLAVNVGKAVGMRTGASVDLDNPELEIFIEARSDRVFVFKDVFKGVGGLPLGSQERMLALVSGGIDSPVAAWMMMRRGCPVSVLYFDASPYAECRVQALDSAKILKNWSSGRRINFIEVPIRKGIEAISARYPRATCVLCRRLMYRIASEVMVQEKAFGIVTGYSLGQVASQTPHNIMAEQVGIDAPVYHPLIAMDKSEIMDMARKIGTYGATEKAGACSAVPKKPITQAKLGDMLEAEEALGLKELAGELVKGMQIERV